MTKEQVLAALRQACVTAGSQDAWAAAHGVSPTYVADTLGGRRGPSGKVLAALGLERVIVYRDVRSEAQAPNAASLKRAATRIGKGRAG